MYQVYTEKNHSELSRTLIIETDDYEIALEKAKKQLKVKLATTTLLKKQMAVLTAMAI